MKFVMSYSCGKDSTLALQKLLEQGHEPVGLLVMINEDLNISWFHGTNHQLLEKLSQSLEIPLILCPSQGDEYHLAFEKGLSRAQELGAEMVGFGDIDLEKNKAWGVARCQKVGLKWEYPLWQRNRRDIVEEIIAKGYHCLIKSIEKSLLPQAILGRKLDPEVMEIMAQSDIDICGENGEYHTLTLGGPIFKTPIAYELGEILELENRIVIEIKI